MIDNFFMDEDLFTALQKEICWFAFSPFEKLPPIDPTLDLDDLATGVGDTRVQRHAFAMIFGAHGYQRDLKRAKILCAAKLGSLEQIEPKTKDLNDPQYAFWLNQLAKYNILLGTIFAYEHDYILAAALLMNGLKTGAIDLSNAYCDFIRFVLSKVEEMPAPLMECEGLGFSADDPMGGTATQGAE